MSLLGQAGIGWEWDQKKGNDARNKSCEEWDPRESGSLFAWTDPDFFPRTQDFSKLDGSLDVDSLPPPELLGTLADVPCNHLHGVPLINVPKV